MSEPFVTVYRGYSPIEADILGDLLRENGIAARVTGTRHGAVIGVAQNIMQLSITVPQSQALQANEFLSAYQEQDGEELLREQGAIDDDDDEDDVSTVARKSPLMAGGLVVTLFGGGHYYAGRPWTAAGLALAQIAAIRWMLIQEWHAMAAGLLTFASVILLDAVFSQFAVRDFNAGVRRGRGSQLAVGLVFAALAVSLGAFVGPHVPYPEAARMPAGEVSP